MSSHIPQCHRCLEPAHKYGKCPYDALIFHKYCKEKLFREYRLTSMYSRGQRDAVLHMRKVFSKRTRNIKKAKESMTLKKKPMDG